ncbi:MAG: hypothetical protein RI907_2888 [Pseudomonadota bacterium]|jgi:hypothetical protein
MRIRLSTPARSALALACLTFCLGAQAAGSDAYLGLALGPSDIDADCSSIAVTSCETGDTGFKLFVGFDVSKSTISRMAVEVSYIDFGQATVRTPVTRRNVTADAVVLDAALRAPLTHSVNVVGRLGVAYVNAKGSGTAGPYLYGTSSDSGLQPHLGAGVEFAINRQFKLTGSFDYTKYDTGAESGSATLFAIGGQMAF